MGKLSEKSEEDKALGTVRVEGALLGVLDWRSLLIAFCN